MSLETTRSLVFIIYQKTPPPLSGGGKKQFAFRRGLVTNASSTECWSVKKRARLSCGYFTFFWMNDVL